MTYNAAGSGCGGEKLPRKLVRSPENLWMFSAKLSRTDVTKRGQAATPDRRPEGTGNTRSDGVSEVTTSPAGLKPDSTSPSHPGTPFDRPCAIRRIPRVRRDDGRRNARTDRPTVRPGSLPSLSTPGAIVFAPPRRLRWRPRRRDTTGPRWPHRQRAIFEFMLRYQAENGRPATVREIAESAGTTYHNGVVFHIKSLVELGYVRAHEKKTNRALSRSCKSTRSPPGNALGK